MDSCDWRIPILHSPLDPLSLTLLSGSPRSVLNRLAALFFSFSLLITPILGVCKVEECGMEFTRNLKNDNVLIGRNIPFCVLLRGYEGCLKRTGRGCRGNIKFHSLRSLLVSQQRKYNCSGLLQSSGYNPDKQQKKPECHFPYQPDQSNNQNGSGGRGNLLCALWGDPHLRTFQGSWETCSVPGAWPLLDNSFLGIQVTNTPIWTPERGRRGEGVPTKITKVTVIIKGYEGCSEQKVYEGDGESGLPSTFRDGTQGRPHLLHVHTHSPHTHVSINVLYISTTINIRRYDGHLSIWTTIPEDVIELKTPADSAQLCLSGCPLTQKLPASSYLSSPSVFTSIQNSIHTKTKWPKPKMPRDRALTLCRERGLIDEFLDACVFDLLVTGDLTFRDAATDALSDARTLFPGHRQLLEKNRTDLKTYDHLAEEMRGIGGASNLHLPSLALFLLIYFILHSFTRSSQDPNR